MIKEKILSHDIIAGILYYLPESCNVFGTRNEIHEIIFNLQEKGYSLLKNFNFSTQGICPVSDELENALFGLLLIRIISYKNPNYYRLEINKNSIKLIKEKILDKKFKKAEIEQLQEIAKEYAMQQRGEIDAEISKI